jgi:hypothetical protein
MRIIKHLQDFCLPDFDFEVVDACGRVVLRSTDCK